MHLCKMNRTRPKQNNITSIYLTITQGLTKIKKGYKQNNFDQMQRQILGQWYFVTKIVLTYCEKKLF